jgi:hypothetical protein
MPYTAVQHRIEPFRSRATPYSTNEQRPRAGMRERVLACSCSSARPSSPRRTGTQSSSRPTAGTQTHTPRLRTLTSSSRLAFPAFSRPAFSRLAFPALPFPAPPRGMLYVLCSLLFWFQTVGAQARHGVARWRVARRAACDVACAMQQCHAAHDMQHATYGVHLSHSQSVQVNAAHLEEGLHRFSQFFIRQAGRRRSGATVGYPRVP